MSKEYKLAVFIGRFQPLHNGHMEVMKHGLKIADKLLILVGSAYSSVNIKNPFTYTERRSMIEGAFTEDELSNIRIEDLRDSYYSENIWNIDVCNKVSWHSDEGDTIALLGNYKDTSSYYLRSFPQWEFTPVKTKYSVDATKIRDSLFKQVKVLSSYLPKNVSAYLNDLVKQYNEGWTDVPSDKKELLKSLIDEYWFINGYKSDHTFTASDYAPTFVTVDSVVLCSGHVLVVKRKNSPGKGLLALPGGFIRPQETIEDAAVRELKEETNIKVDKDTIKASIIENKYFDHPNRSLRGRTITHAFCVKLKDGVLPEVKGSDDAEKAMWMRFTDISDDKFYEDHSHIIRYFIRRN